MRPLTTQHASRLRPILTSCTCPTLHHLAQRVVDHLRGKTLAQIRNEMGMGVVGPRSTVAFRHTVLRENMLPAFGNQLFGHETKIASPIEDKTGERHPTTTYLHMLDKYGSLAGNVGVVSGISPPQNDKHADMSHDMSVCWRQHVGDIEPCGSSNAVSKLCRCDD